MPKARTKKANSPDESKKANPPQKPEPLSPAKVHELFGIAGPYDPPPAPMPLVGYCAFWDGGLSILRMGEKWPDLFYSADWLDSARFAKETDSWRWRQIRLAPIGPGKTFAEQSKQLLNADKPAAARELVAFLILRFLTTGERFEMERWRCSDVLPCGKRVIVGPFSSLGLDIGSVRDTRESPGVALSAIFTPPRKI